MSPMRSTLGEGGAAVAGPGATRLRRERTVLLLVDLQERLLPAIFEHERLLANALLLVRAAQALEIPMLLTTQYRKGLGDVVAELEGAARGAPIIDKLSFGCFGAEEFVEWFVQRPARDQLLMCGIESHVCVLQTAMGALERGLVLHVAADSVGSRTDSNHRLGLARMERMGAVITSAEMAVFELLERAEGEAFRQVLPLLKASG